MKMNKRKLVGILLVIGSLYIPPFIGIKILPTGWAKELFTYWWTIPTMAILVSFTILGFLTGFIEIFDPE
jgi:hypothetical protein